MEVKVDPMSIVKVNKIALLISIVCLSMHCSKMEDQGKWPSDHILHWTKAYLASYNQ